jgi:cysteinyl-tRNA synthetase
MAQVWMHNGFLQVEGEKMSKSVGNFITIRDLLQTETFGGRRWPGEVLRLAMLRTHYRQPIDWTVRSLEEAERTLDRWYAAVEAASPLVGEEPPCRTFLDALSDDLNTPAALGELHGLFSAETLHSAVASANILGLLEKTPNEWRAQRESEAGINTEAVEALIAARLAARVARNWAESDRIRNVLSLQGVTLKDNKDGTTSWSLSRKGAA